METPIMHVRVPMSLRDRLKSRAVIEQRTESALIRAAVEDYLRPPVRIPLEIRTEYTDWERAVICVINQPGGVLLDPHETGEKASVIIQHLTQWIMGRELCERWVRDGLDISVDDNDAVTVKFRD